MHYFLPFGPSRLPRFWFSCAGNRLHLTFQLLSFRNDLLFEKKKNHFFVFSKFKQSALAECRGGIESKFESRQGISVQGHPMQFRGFYNIEFT
jgi:hypothetical protein